MDSLDLPQDMLWPGKAEPMSPEDHRWICASSNSAAPQLWPIEEDILLSCFDIDDDSNTTTTTFGQDSYDLKGEQQKREEEQEDVDKSRAEELLLELIELKEEGQWMSQENLDLSLLTAAVASAPQFVGFPVAAASSTYPASISSSSAKAESVIEGTTNYVADTELLYNEIKSFCSDFEAEGYQHLTPPQSPPTTTKTLFAADQYQQAAVAQQHSLQPQTQHQLPNVGFGGALTSGPSSAAALNQFEYEGRSFMDLQLQSNECLDKTFVIAAEEPGTVTPQQQTPIVDSDLLALELIDDLLRNKTKDVHENYVLVNTHQLGSPEQQRTQDSFDYCEDGATQFSTPSYGNSLASSPSRSGSPLDSQDDDWTPAEQPSPKKQKRGGSRSLASSSSGGSSSKRRPYERGCGEQEKKSRKKEQNKNAATRYRQKKKQEVETILDEENRLKKTNKKLVAQFEEARREMRYLRNLLRDMYKQNDIHI